MLCASLLFYAANDLRALAFVLLSSVSIYFATTRMQRISDAQQVVFAQNTKEWAKANKKAMQKQSRAQKSKYLKLALGYNLGVLFLVKYLPNLATACLGLVWPAQNISISFLLPLGISFYTFQGVGYLIDVYYDKVSAEKNYGKTLLFLSYFPQVVQGPISKAKSLLPQLGEGNRFDYTKFKFGLQLVLWGLLKKLIVGDILAGFVSTVIATPQEFAGAGELLAVVCAYLQLYGDFSGGIDVARGISECFGVTLPINFARPFFSTSITDYWRRWHITLGTFMKDYVLMPLNLSKPMVKLGKITRERFGIKYGKYIPTSLGTLVVFLLVGAWHAASLPYLLFGLYNGVIIAIEAVVKGLHKKKARTGLKKVMHHAAALLYTWVALLVGIIIYSAQTVAASLQIAQKILFDFHPTALGTAFFDAAGFSVIHLAVALGGFALVMGVELLQERGIKVRETVAKQHLLVQYAIFLALIAFLFIYASYATAEGGFAYAAF